MSDLQLRNAVRKYYTTNSFIDYVRLAHLALRHRTSVAILLGPARQETLLKQMLEILDDHTPLRGFNLSLERISEDGGWSSSSPDNFGTIALFTEDNPIRGIYNDFNITVRAIFPYSPYLESDWDVENVLEQLNLMGDMDNWDRCRKCLSKRSHTTPNCSGYNSMGVVIQKSTMLAQSPHLKVYCGRVLPEDVQEQLMDDPYAIAEYRAGHQTEVNDLVQHVCEELTKLYPEVRCPSPHDYCFIHSSPSRGW